MSYQTGDQFRLKVNTTGVTFVIAKYMNRVGKNTQRTVSKQSFPYFGDLGVPIEIVGTAERTRTYDVAGFYDPVDVGQLALLAAEAADTPIKIQMLHNGTDGYEQQIKVSSFRYDVTPEPQSLQGIAFTFEKVADATLVGAGPIL